MLKSIRIYRNYKEFTNNICLRVVHSVNAALDICVNDSWNIHSCGIVWSMTKDLSGQWHLLDACDSISDSVFGQFDPIC